MEDGSVPLPDNFSYFLSVSANKADLADFLSKQLIENITDGKTLVIAGGFQQEDEVWASDRTLNLDLLKANHVEADARLVLHCVHSDAACVVVSSNDTDVLILLLAHFH